MSGGITGKGEPRRMPIDSVVENADGTVLLTGKGLDDTWVFQADGTILLKHANIVLKRAK